MMKNNIFTFDKTVEFIDKFLLESDRIKQKINKSAGTAQYLLNMNKEVLRMKKLTNNWYKNHHRNFYSLWEKHREIINVI